MSRDLTPDSETLRVMEKIEVRAVARPAPVLFMIYTHAPHHATACRAQFETWGARVQKILFFSDKDDPSLPIVNIPHEGPESYDNIWRKVISMVRHVGGMVGEVSELLRTVNCHPSTIALLRPLVSPCLAARPTARRALRELSAQQGLH